MRFLIITFISTVFTCLSVKADHTPTAQDTIKTYYLDEVTVTSSTKETNRLMKLPGAVSLITPRTINARQIDALKDLSAFVPNLYIPDYGAKLTSAIYIRGIGARSSGQSIGLYVDDIPYLDKSLFDFELTDLQRIEVLRGPQGTLYGRNSMGGIINIYTLSPFDYQGTKLSVSAGNYGQFKVKGSHSMKFNDKVALSLSAYYDHCDGFFENYAVERRGKADALESVGGRLRLDWRINPRLSLGYSFATEYTDQGGFPYGRYDATTGKVDSIKINDPSSYRRTMLSNNLRLQYKTDRYILTSTTGHQYLNDDMKMDQDYSEKSIFTLNQLQRQNAFSQEVTIRSNTTSNYQWSNGLYGFYNDLHTDGPVTFKEDGIKEVLQPVFDEISKRSDKMPHLIILDNSLYIPGSFETPTYGLALFHQSTCNNLFTKGLSITAGIRVDYERQEIDYQSESKMNLGAQFEEGGAIIPLENFFKIPTTVMDVHSSQDFWQVLPKVSLKYECTPRTFTYLSVAKGYKAGGYNVQMSADLMQNQMQYDMMKVFEGMMGITVEEPAGIQEVAAYKPEKSWNYELGMKSELLKKRLMAELTFYYMDVKDIQLTQFVGSGNGRILTNAGKARSYGIEASLQALLTNDLTADINYGYTYATFRDYHDGREDYKGNYIPYTPQHTLNIGLSYSKLINSRWIDQFIASAQYSGAGKIYWSEKNDIAQNFYGTLNAKVGVRKGNIRLDLWGRNLTDTDFNAFYFESRSIPFFQKGKPLQIGAELAVSF